MGSVWDLHGALDLTGKVEISKYHFSMGGFAVLYRGTATLPSGVKAVAIKLPKICDENANRKFRREELLWAQLSHPNVTNIIGVVQNVPEYHPAMLGLVLPYFENGDLKSYIQHKILIGADVDYPGLILGAGRGLSYLHIKGIVHGDIKENNILVNDHGEAVLADFGLSRIQDIRGFTTSDIRGNPRWLAVELLRPYVDLSLSGHPIPLHTFQTDVWAFAMTIVEIYTRRLPFHPLPATGVALAVVANGYLPSPQSCPEVPNDLWPLLESCWNFDPSQRPRMTLIESLLQNLLR